MQVDWVLLPTARINVRPPKTPLKTRWNWAWKAREAFDPDAGSLSTWVFRIARNVCFDRLREAQRPPLPGICASRGIDVGAGLQVPC